MKSLVIDRVAGILHPLLFESRARVLESERAVRLSGYKGG